MPHAEMARSSRLSCECHAKLLWLCKAHDLTLPSES
jgi:hypothetical protein